MEKKLMTRRRLLQVAGTAAGAALIRSPGGAWAQQAQRLSIATGGTGGVFYVYGGGIANVLTKTLPNTKVTAEATAAAVDNCKLIGARKADLAFCPGDVMYDAYVGTGKLQVQDPGSNSADHLRELRSFCGLGRIGDQIPSRPSGETGVAWRSRERNGGESGEDSGSHRDRSGQRDQAGSFERGRIRRGDERPEDRRFLLVRRPAHGRHHGPGGHSRGPHSNPGHEGDCSQAAGKVRPGLFPGGRFPKGLTRAWKTTSPPRRLPSELSAMRRWRRT